MECLAKVGAVLGEGPVWVAREQALYWLDIPGRKVFRWSDADGVKVIEVAHHVCSLLPRQDGGFIGGGYDGFLSIAPDWTISPIADPEPDLPANRFNDGKIDRAGRLWAGTMDRREQEASGSLYRLDRDLCWTRADTGYRVTNGPAFSVDGRTCITPIPPFSASMPSILMSMEGRPDAVFLRNSEKATVSPTE